MPQSSCASDRHFSACNFNFQQCRELQVLIVWLFAFIVLVTIFYIIWNWLVAKCVNLKLSWTACAGLFLLGRLVTIQPRGWC